MSKVKFVAILLIAVLIGTSACSSKYKAGRGQGLDENGEVPQLSDQDLAMREQNFGGGNIPLAAEQAQGLFKDIPFEYDSSAIGAEGMEQLREDAKVLLQDSSLRAEVEGHCDSRGTNEYNMALGEERAKAVAGTLTKLGVSKEQLTWISYGEEIPIDPASSEGSYAKNRRAHFALFRNRTANR